MIKFILQNTTKLFNGNTFLMFFFCVWMLNFFFRKWFIIFAINVQFKISIYFIRNWLAKSAACFRFEISVTEHFFKIKIEQCDRTLWYWWCSNAFNVQNCENEWYNFEVLQMKLILFYVIKSRFSSLSNIVKNFLPQSYLTCCHCFELSHSLRKTTNFLTHSSCYEETSFVC